MGSGLLLGAGVGGSGWNPPAFPTISSGAPVARFEADSGLGLANNAPVGTWTSAFGGGWAYAPYGATSSRRPLFKATGWDAVRPCVTFDGVDDLLDTGYMGSASLQPPYTRFLVCRWDTAYVSGDSKLYDGNASYGLLARINATDVQTYASGSTANIASTTPTSNHLYMVSFGTALSRIRIDIGATVSTVSVNTGGQAGLVLGGLHAAGGGYGAVSVAADITYLSLADADIALMEAYLKAKWATP